MKKISIMPKMKTHSSAKKRFKVTGSGKIKRRRAGTSHLLRKKSKRAKLMLSHSAIVSKADEKRIKKLLLL
jgi:LSU ribosomal protein L35P